MAQKTEKEDAEFKAVPETLTPCINNCIHASLSSSSGSAPFHLIETRTEMINPEADVETRMVTIRRVEEASPVAKREVNRCKGCRRKVGLTGFRCRCGNMFCAEHRYSDRHECSYDYKAAGKSAIAKENPIVKAAKIVRI